MYIVVITVLKHETEFQQDTDISRYFFKKYIIQWLLGDVLFLTSTSLFTHTINGIM